MAIRNQTKYQVFVSSTFKDLEPQRQDIFNALYKNSCIPIGMEGFTPGNKGQLAYIKDRIDECDYFIVIVAHRYGSDLPGSVEKISITEWEYDYAINKKNIPISRFIIDPKTPWPSDADHRSEGDDLAALNRFKLRLAKSKRDIFDTNPWNESNLVEKVISSVGYMIREEPRTGLVRPKPVMRDCGTFGIDRVMNGLRAVEKKPHLIGHRSLWIILNDGYNFFEANLESIGKAVEAGTDVRVLLVHPDSPCLPAIADKSSKSFEQQKDEILNTISLLKQKFGKFPNFRLRGHLQFNTYAAIINEKSCLVDFYFNFRLEDKRQDDRVALKCEAINSDNSIHKKIRDDFEYFWRSTERDRKNNLLTYDEETRIILI